MSKGRGAGASFSPLKSTSTRSGEKNLLARPAIVARAVPESGRNSVTVTRLPSRLQRARARPR